MSKIDVVLKQYCSNGVPRVPLGSKISLVRGSRLTKNQLSIDTGFPVYQNSLKPLGYHSNYNTLGDSTFVICAGAAGEVDGHGRHLSSQMIALFLIVLRMSAPDICIMSY